MSDDELDPFARLTHTHRRIEQRLEGLRQAAADLPDPAKRFAAQQVVGDVVGFLSRAGRKHVDDEEQTLHPRLREIAALQPLLAEIEREHVEHLRLDDALRTLVDAWGDEGPDGAGERRVAELARELSDVYRAHIRREEEELFPAARAALSPEATSAMGREMIERRPRGQGRGGQHGL